MQIPWIGSSATGRSLNINAQRTINMFVLVDKDDAKTPTALIGTPGLKAFSTLETEASDSCVRCLHITNDLLYSVCGNRVYSTNSSGTSTYIGTISSSTGNVFIDDNGIQSMLVDGSGTSYILSGGTLTAITDADLPNADSVTFQDGYFIITKKNSGKIYISTSYDGTAWAALDFVTAEAKSDNAIRVISTNRELWIFGTETVEAFYYSGDATFPFDRIQGSVMHIGTNAAASVCNVYGQLYWLGHNRQVVRNVGYQPQVISTPTLDYQIASYSTVSDARSYCCTIDGHIWYVLIFPTEKKTWMYDTSTQMWFELESYNNKDVALPWSRHRSNCCVRFADKEIVGDYENGKLYEFDMSTYTDNSQQIQRIRQTQFISKERVDVIYHSLEVEFEAGVGLSGGVQGEDPQACLQWSNDNAKTWSSEYWLSIGKIGEYSARAIWRRLGKARNRTFRCTVADPVKVVMLGAYAELEALEA